jgi:3-oxoadipate enol-lactonase
VTDAPVRATLVGDTGRCPFDIRLQEKVSRVIPHHVVDGQKDAPALVLCNSLGSTLAMWDPQVPALAERFRVVRHDLRGHGASPIPPPPYELADLGGDVLELMDQLGLPRAHLCGASLGGQVCMWVAANAPERVDRLILCGSSAWFGPPDAWFERARLVRAEGTGAVADAVVGRWFTAGFAGEHPDVVARMRDMIAASPREGYAACCEVVGTTDLRPELGAIAAPTLVVAGEHDPAVSAEDVEALSTGIARCTVERVDAAHLASVERSGLVTGLIERYLLAAKQAT